MADVAQEFRQAADEKALGLLVLDYLGRGCEDPFARDCLEEVTKWLLEAVFAGPTVQIGATSQTLDVPGLARRTPFLMSVGVLHFGRTRVTFIRQARNRQPSMMQIGRLAAASFNPVTEAAKALEVVQTVSGQHGPLTQLDLSLSPLVLTPALERLTPSPGLFALEPTKTACQVLARGLQYPGVVETTAQSIRTLRVGLRST